MNTYIRGKRAWFLQYPTKYPVNVWYLASTGYVYKITIIIFHSTSLVICSLWSYIESKICLTDLYLLHRSSFDLLFPEFLFFVSCWKMKLPCRRCNYAQYKKNWMSHVVYSIVKLKHLFYFELSNNVLVVSKIPTPLRIRNLDCYYDHCCCAV